MEERILRRQELQDPTTTDAAPVLSSGDDTDGDSEEFEFPFVSRGSPALADDLFADGLIRPFYPVFDHRGAGGTGADDLALAAAPAAARRTRGQLGRLFLEESRAWNSSTGSTSSSSAATDDYDGDAGLEGAPPESYCVWAPGSSASPQPPPRKSGSTGSMARWRRISDLVVGRSHSDGKEKFLFLPATPPPPPNKPKNPRPKPNPAGGNKKAASGTEINTVAAAHRIAYGAKASSAGGGATLRRTFLPYREELVGFFANVNGISRSHAHPY